MTFVQFIVDDILPMMNIVLSLNIVRMNIHTLKFRKIDSQYRIILVCGMVLGCALAGMYFLILMQFDHLLEPNADVFASLYMRPLMSAVIVFLNISGQYRLVEKKETTRVDTDAPTRK